MTRTIAVFALLLAPVPEPTTVGLVAAVGLMAVRGLRRRRANGPTNAV
ncbi:MAG: PEP-CTERM sorting domain-containing protein [Fimbriiglobus sp.]